MDHREQALLQIKKLLTENGLSWEDVRQSTSQVHSEAKVLEVSEMLAYLGGILIFAGIGVYATMFWGTFSSVFRIVLTFGSGFSCYCIALGLSQNLKYQKVAQALFLISVILQPMGLYVFFDEIYGIASHMHVATLFVFGIMLVQQFATFWEKRLNLILCMVIFFGLGLISTLFNYLDFNSDYALMGLGTSLCLIIYSLKHTPYKPCIGFWYCIATIMFLCGAWHWLYNPSYPIVFPAICAFLIYLSVLIKSRAILFTTTIGLLAYIGQYTVLYFVNSVGWPISLILMGTAFILLSGFAFRIKKKYM